MQWHLDIYKYPNSSGAPVSCNLRTTFILLKPLRQKMKSFQAKVGLNRLQCL